MTEPTVRTASPADVAAIEALEAVSFPEPWSRRLLAEELRYAHALVLVAEKAGAVVGFATFRRVADESELLRVAVSPSARNRGVARRLVAAGLDELRRRGVTRCHLEVRPANTPARALYRRLGFQETGRRKGYYADGSDALLLCRELLPGAASFSTPEAG